MLLSKTIMVKVNSIRGINKYRKLGYNLTDDCKEFDCKIKDSPISNMEYVTIKCDYCGKEYKMKYNYYYNTKKDGIINKDACEDCRVLKYKESMTKKYGADNSMHLDEFKEKIKQTNLDRYGYVCNLNIPELKENIKNKFKDKYGVEYYSQTEECKTKVKNTNISKFNKEYYSQTESYKQNIIDTCNEKYGVNNVSQVKEVKLKKARSFYKNGTVATSRQQEYLWKLLGGELNYSNNTPSLDIAFPDEKIYIEVNFSGHDLCVKLGSMSLEEFNKREKRRYYYMKKLGWKGIFITSPRDYLPSDEILLEEIIKAKEWLKVNEFGHSHYNIDVGEFVQDKKYGKLRRIKHEDLEVSN